MELISTVTVGAGGATSIIFNSIPQTYTDLYLLVSSRTNLSGSHWDEYLNINATGTTNRRLLGNGSTATSSTGAVGSGFGWVPGSTSTTNTFSNTAIYIPNYTATGAKTASSDTTAENNGTTAYTGIYALACTNTSPVTSLEIYVGGTGYVQYSTASLYGILKGSGGATVA